MSHHDGEVVVIFPVALLYKVVALRGFMPSLLLMNSSSHFQHPLSACIPSSPRVINQRIVEKIAAVFINPSARTCRHHSRKVAMALALGHQKGLSQWLFGLGARICPAATGVCLSPRFLGFLLKKTEFLSAPLLRLAYFLVLMLSSWSVPMEKIGCNLNPAWNKKLWM